MAVAKPYTLKNWTSCIEGRQINPSWSFSHTRTHARMHACTHARTHARTHTPSSNTHTNTNTPPHSGSTKWHDYGHWLSVVTDSQSRKDLSGRLIPAPARRPRRVHVSHWHRLSQWPLSGSVDQLSDSFLYWEGYTRFTLLYIFFRMACHVSVRLCPLYVVA